MKLTHPRFSTKMFHIHIWCRVSNFRHILICCLRFHESSWYLDRAVYPCHQSDQRKNLQKSKIQLWFDCLGKNNAELFHANRYQSKCLRANDLNHRVCYKLLSQLRFSFHSVKQKGQGSNTYISDVLDFFQHICCLGWISSVCSNPPTFRALPLTKTSSIHHI